MGSRFRISDLCSKGITPVGTPMMAVKNGKDHGHDMETGIMYWVSEIISNIWVHLGPIFTVEL